MCKHLKIYLGEEKKKVKPVKSVGLDINLFFLKGAGRGTGRRKRVNQKHRAVPPSSKYPPQA